MCPVTMAENGDKTRIYVGGLGVGVTEDDLRKTFSSLGDVIAVDIVRTKDRSFAYLDFLPSSDKSLPKLFSTYNGCMWKGGKLRLEKAKEHYLLRLKREWQEESESAIKASDGCKADLSGNNDALQKPKKLSPADKAQFNIYFPKLGKVKSLAQIGIGKHKYSFQRIQVPDTPTHFCDCEEHSRAFPPPLNKKQSSELEKASYAINEQELDIMNSVMNKILERANPSKQVSRKSESKNGKDELIAAENDEEDNLTDEDNLVINVGNGKTDTMDLIGEMRTMMANRTQEAKRQTSSTGKSKIEKKTLPPTKKRKSPHSEENDSSKTQIPEASKNLQTRLETRKDSKPNIDLGTKQPENNSLRSLKFSWKGLIGETRKTSFDISNFIATMPQRKEEDLKVDDTDHSPKETNLVSNKKRKSDDDKNEPALYLNIEPTTEVEALTTETTTFDILTTDFQQKDEEPKAINVDILANDCQQKVQEPKADNVEEVPLTSIGQQFGITDAAGDLEEKHEEPKADNVKMSSTTVGQQFSTTDVARDLDQKEEEPRANDLDCTFGNADCQTDNSNDLKKSSDQDLIKTARGDFWRHKSSWTQLISTTSHTSFSISQIVPGVNFKELEQKTDILDSQPATKNLDDQHQSSVEKEITSSPVKKKTSEKRRTVSIGSLESEGTCSFMRTDESMKEWKKAKTSHSSSLNKKKRQAIESA